MSAHNVMNNPDSAHPAHTEIRPNNDELESHHDQAQLTEGNMATPDSLISDAASETLVYIEHPLHQSPTSSNPEGFSPYNYSSGSSQSLSSPCMRLVPDIQLDSPLHQRSSPPSQLGNDALPWRSLPLRIPMNRQLRAVVSLPSSSFAASPASSTVSTDRQGPESLQMGPKLPPDQLGFSKGGFTPLPLTTPPSNEPRHARKLSGSRDAQALLTDVARLFGSMDDESRAKFATEIGQIVGLEKYEEGYRKGIEDTRARREEEEEEPDR